MNRKHKILSALVILAALFFFAGCTTYNNNYLNAEDFASYLERDGIKVDGVRSLPGEPFRASNGCAIMVDGGEIGVYKYDRNSSVQEKRIAKIGEEGLIYIVGVPFPVEVRGSFMFLGFEKHPRKHQMTKTADKFY